MFVIWIGVGRIWKLAVDSWRGNSLVEWSLSIVFVVFVSLIFFLKLLRIIFYLFFFLLLCYDNHSYWCL